MPATGVKLENLSYIIFYVKDMAAAISFYRDTLGLTLKADSPDWTEFSTGATTLALHVLDDRPSPAGKGHPEVSFTVSDIEATHSALKSAGVAFVKEPHVVYEADKVKVMAAQFHDLDGNLLSLFCTIMK